jgi:hypothetical protein
MSRKRHEKLLTRLNDEIASTEQMLATIQTADGAEQVATIAAQGSQGDPNQSDVPDDAAADTPDAAQQTQEATPEPQDISFDIKMKPGKGYGWLAGQINKEMESIEGWSPINHSNLRSRMQDQMLYRNHVYTFSSSELLAGGAISGGMDSTQIRTAQQGMAYWEREGREKFFAERELGEVLEVIGDDEEATSPDQVTQSEFNDAAETYGNVRLGRGDLTLDTSHMSPAEARQFREDTFENMETMMTTDSGRQQIQSLSDNPLMDDSGNERQFLEDGTEVTGTAQEEDGQAVHRHTTITDLHQDANADRDRSNDNQAPLDHTNAFADPADATWQQGFRQADGSRGEGTDTTLRINSGTTIDGVVTPQDVVLMHEMSHADDQTQGTMEHGQISVDTIDPVTGEAVNECREDLIDSSNPDLTGDRGGPVNVREHQAAGLGHYTDDEMTERSYRDERQELDAKNDDGTPLGDRPAYAELP